MPIKLEYGMIPFSGAGRDTKRPVAVNHINPAAVINYTVQNRSLVLECIGGRTVTVYQTKPQSDDEEPEDINQVKMQLLKDIEAYRFGKHQGTPDYKPAEIDREALKSQIAEAVTELAELTPPPAEPEQPEDEQSPAKAPPKKSAAKPRSGSGTKKKLPPRKSS